MSSLVGVVGAGLVGCLAALAFAAKGYEVTLFEMRPDPSTVRDKNLRSINLAVSDRGIRALRYVDDAMATRVLAHVIPMYGRMIHDREGRQQLQPYGLFGECINSIDRSFLNEALLAEIRRAGVKVHFGHKLVRVDMAKRPTLVFGEGQYEFDYVVGADGAHLRLRGLLQRLMRMDYAQKYIDMQYIELLIPSGGSEGSQGCESPNGPGVDGGHPTFQLNPNHLHIWPRGQFMLIALANEDGSFTCTFFSPWLVIEGLRDADAFVAFFRTHFPDAVELIGTAHLRSAYASHPRGALMQVEMHPYHHPSGRAVVLGDAAHLMVPFYGQGMNCGFEDVRVLMELIDETGDPAAAFARYSAVRHRDLQAICKLAMDNYYEMLSKVTSRRYLLRKQIDAALGRVARRWWIPMYTMILFRGDIAYSRAVAIERRQARILAAIEVSAVALAAAALAKLWH